MIFALRKRPPMGEAAEIGRWYIGIEIRSHHPALHAPRWAFVFRPYVMAYCVRFDEVGHPGTMYGGVDKKRGGIWRWECPFGFRISIESV